MANYDDNFEHLVGGNYGRLEAEVGSELYRGQVELNQKHIALLESQREYGIEGTKADMLVSHSKALLLRSISAWVTIATLMTIIIGVTYTIMLWRNM